MKLVVISVIKKKNVFLVKILSWTLVFLYLGFMYMPSIQDRTAIDSLSKSIANALEPYIPVPVISDGGGIYGMEYFVLSLLLCMALYSCGLKSGKRSLLVLSICLLLAVLEKFYQMFISGKSPGIIDLIFDVTGGIFGLVFVYLISIIRERFGTGVVR